LVKGTKTKIVATVGPAINSKEMIEKLINRGVDIFRLNFSHGKHEQHLKSMEIIREASKKLGYPIAILQDLQGPKIRVGDFENKVELVAGDSFKILKEEVTGNQYQCSLTYAEILLDLKPGMRLMINDGLIILKVISIHSWGVDTTVEVGGEISSHKGLNIPEASLRSIPALTSKDLIDLKFGIENKVDYIAISFVRSAMDIELLRWEIKKYGYSIEDIPYIIAKIEKPQAVKAIDDILEKVEGIMVARGDLGIEVEMTKLPTLQRELINKANIKGKLVITATQMLDSMTHNYTPTRAEVTDVANAVLDGTDAVMLSGETAVGEYPEHTVNTMNDILINTEQNIIENPYIYRSKLLYEKNPTIEGAISSSVSLITQKLPIKAILCYTSSGYTPIVLSKARPEAPIIAYCLDSRVKRKLALTWGTLAKLISEPKDYDDLIFKMEADLLKEEDFRKGDFVIIVASLPLGTRKSTNTIKIHQL